MKSKIFNVFKIISIFLILTQCLSEKLIRDPNFPILVKYATKTTSGLELQLRFKFPAKKSSDNKSTISGIAYNQFIGVIFPAASNINFSSTSVGCALSTSTQTYSMAFKAPTTLTNMSTSSNGNYLYCQLTDTSVDSLHANDTFTLTLTFPTAFSTNFFSNIGLFTSTSNNPDQIIIDYTPCFGSIGLYEDFTLSDRNKIALISAPGSTLSTITSPSSANYNTLYPYFTIDLSIIVELANTWIPYTEDYVFLFKYNPNSFTAPNSVKSESANTINEVASEAALATPLSLSTFEEGAVIINGIDGNDLYPKRKFKLTFSGLKTKDTNLDSQTQCELWILHRNTYSVVSYSKINMDKVNKINMSGDVHHNEYYDIFDGMGWPMEINFKTSYDIPEGGYVVVRHRDFSKAVNSFVFVSSSCDFSEFTSLEQNFGKRWNCYPLRNDFNFTDEASSSSGNKEAHGFFFKMNTISSTVENYKLKIWGFAENCYNSSETTNYYRTKLAFTIRVFKKAENSIREEKRFFDNTANGNYVIAEQLSLEGPLCYPLQLNSSTAASPTEINSTDSEIIGDITRAVGSEFTNVFVFKAPTSESTLSNSFDFLKIFGDTKTDLSKNSRSTNLVERFVFGTTSDLADTSLFFGAAISSSLGAGQKLVASFIPTECKLTSTNTSAKLSNLEDVRIKWYFSRYWFSQNIPISDTTTGCQLSWKVVAETGGNITKNTTIFLENTSNNRLYDNANTTLISKSITFKDTTPADVTKEANIDTTVSKINSSSTSLTGTDLQYVISSKAISVYDGSTLGLFGDDCTSTSPDTDASFNGYLSILVYTNCLKWISKPTQMKSLYSYFDAQAHLTVANKPLRMWRFIKLYPELGVFQQPSITAGNIYDTSSTDNTVGSLGRWATGHYSVTSQSSSPFAVCVIELNSAFVESFYDTTTNTLIIWLFAASLVDVDILNSSSEYPIAGVSNGKPYGLNAGQTISGWSRMVTFDATSGKQLTTPDGAQVQATTADVASRLEYEIYAVTMNYPAIMPASTAAVLSSMVSQQRTHYVPLLASTIYINNITSKIVNTTTPVTNLYIPFLCPSLTNLSSDLTASAATGLTNGVHFVSPIITAVWAQMSAYNSISKIGNYIRASSDTNKNYYNTLISYQAADKITLLKTDIVELGTTTDYYHPAHTPLLLTNLDTVKASLSANIDFDFAKSNYKTSSLYTDKYKGISLLKAYFNDFSYTSDNDVKTLTISAPNATSSNPLNASCFSFYLSSKLSTESTVEITLPEISDTLKSYKSTASFYILGNPFVTMLTTSYKNAMLPEAAADYSQSVKLTSSSKINVIGINRLPISYYDNTTQVVNIFNQLAIFFTSNLSNSSDNTSITKFGIGSNLAIDTNSSSTTSLADFVLYHAPTNTNDWTNRVLAPDLNTEIYTNDKASNIKFSATLPSEIAKGSKLTITLGNTALVSISICGLIENGIDNIVTPCTISSSSAVCPVNKRTSSFTLCCYNISTSSTVTVVAGGNVTYTAPSTVSALSLAPFSSAYNTSIYAPTTTTWATYSITNPVDITSTTFYAELKDIKYSLTTTNGGFGRADFEINLPRNPVRGMLLEVFADISALQINNVKTRLSATFGASKEYGLNMNQGDIFIEGLYTNFDNNGIKLQLKNIIYKCGIQLSRNLTITMLPVKVTNYVNLSSSVLMKAADSFSLAYADSRNVTSTPNLSHTPLVLLVQNDFCKITKIFPKVIGQYAEYTLEMDLKQYSATLEGSKPNEITFFLPYMYYGGMQENIVCYSGASQIECNYIDKSVISIRFPSVISTSGESPITVKIAGLYNPILDLNNQVYFACSLNETDFKLSERKNLIRGITTYSDGITYPTDVKFGNIRFINKETYHSKTILENTSTKSNASSIKGIVPLNPREEPSKIESKEISIHQVGFTIDTSNRLLDVTTDSYTIDGNPFLVVTFPKAYKLNWYRVDNYKFQIESYKLNDLDYKTVEKYNLLTFKSYTVSGNMITINFNEPSFTINKFHQYFILKMYDIPSVVDTTIDSNTGRQTTEYIDLLMTNDNKTKIFKTWNNLNTLSKDEMQPTKLNNILSNNKGFKYEYDQKRWIIDVYDKDKQVFNNITLRTGRYMTYHFKVRTTSKVLRHLAPKITILNNKFSLATPEAVVATAYNSEIPFDVGVACEESPSYMIAKPEFVKNQYTNLNIYDYFLPLSPVEVYIKSDTLGVIKFEQVNVVRINGSYFVDFTLSEPSFTNININFEAGQQSEIDNTVIKATELTTRTVFRMTDKETTDKQTFKMGTPSSSCYVYQHDVITFDIDGIAAIIPNDGVQDSNFTFYNSATDPDNQLEKNAVKFKFETIYTQIYIYAVLTCIDKEFPSDQDMKTQNVAVNKDTGYFSEILNIQGSADIVFKNMVRGQKYKLKVYVESTQGDISERTESTISIFNYTLSNGTVIDIMPTPTQGSKCASYRFETKPGVQVKDPLRWYWQNKFSSSGYNSSGCITVIDQYGNQAPGIPNFKNDISCESKTCNFKQDIESIVNQTSLNVEETYILCAKQFPTCPSDINGIDDKFNEILSELDTKESFKSVLNIEVVPPFELTTVVDGNLPNIPEVSEIEKVGIYLEFKTALSEGTENADCVYIATTGAEPTEEQFNECKREECTYVNTKVGSTTKGKIEIGENNTGNYQIFSKCRNEIPCSSEITQVKDVGSGSIDGGNSNSTNSTSNLNNTNQNNTNKTGSSVSRIAINFAVVIAIIFGLMF